MTKCGQKVNLQILQGLKFNSWSFSCFAWVINYTSVGLAAAAFIARGHGAIRPSWGLVLVP
jgi:hypothetical protein